MAPETLAPLLPVFLTYVLSFVYVGIYWGNHHYLLHFCGRVAGTVLWANLHLLFWLSLLPFVTGWMGQNHFAPLPTAVYGGVLSAGRWRTCCFNGPSSSLKEPIPGSGPR